MAVTQSSSTENPSFSDQLQSEQSSLPRRAIPAWLLSFLVHSVLFAIGIFLVGRFSQGASEVETRTGGIVLVDVQSETTEYLSEGEVDDSSSASQQQSPPPLPADDERPPDLPGMNASESQLTGVGDDFNQLTGADSLLNGTSSNRPLGGRVTTEVFGVKGTGSVFVYVFDRSASMEGYEGRPLRAAKKQLIESVESLGDKHQFQIIFYNDGVKIFRSQSASSARLVFAEAAAKRNAFSFINNIRGERGTNHMQALQAALRLGPDVIFLLTDAEGGFTSREMNILTSWNRAGTIINAIEFGVGNRANSDGSLKRLANETGGQYTYKNVLTLRD